MPEVWPEIPFEPWKESCATLHLWTQIVGKYRLARTPWVNHSWHATLYLTPRGLTTSEIPDGTRAVQVDFDFIDHALIVSASDGAQQRIELQPMAVADFHARFRDALEAIGANASFHSAPNEVANPIPFARDREHAAYDADAVQRFWRALLRIDRVFKHFRTGFLGKCSPVHLFWGSFDLAVTRFSGRTAPPHPGGIPALPDEITREAYSHEVSSAGFWPGGGPIDDPAFYAYAYPTPEGFAEAAVGPKDAVFDRDLGEFLLPYDAVRGAADPEAVLLEFLQTTYAAAADLAGWDRSALETELGRPGVPRAA
ncbi:MAG: DUF5996 family protein [Kiloniellales bacterium]|nr:DUF5996 family protein [Kiloniellales bacterium]